MTMLDLLHPIRDCVRFVSYVVLHSKVNHYDTSVCIDAYTCKTAARYIHIGIDILYFHEMRFDLAILASKIYAFANIFNPYCIQL